MRLFMLAAWLVAAASPAAARQAQFCSTNSTDTLDYCVAVDADGLTAGTMHLKASLDFKSNAGWAAIGSGTRMADASMVVFHLNEARDGLTVSVRSTAAGHEAPQLDVKLADRLEWDARRVGDFWQAEVTCHECTSGDGTSWIWAVNTAQQLASNEFDAPMQMHNDFGRWELDATSMRQGFGGDGLFNPRETWGVSTLPAHVHAAHQHSTAIWLHGLCMAAAFLFLLPLGAVTIRMPDAAAFRRHWMLQVLGGVGVVLGATLALAKVLTRHSLLESLLKLHHGLGVVISAAVLLQLGLGYRHHVDYLRLGHRTRVSDLHVWLGRLVIPLGWLNTAYGASFHNSLTGSSLLTWLAVAACAGAWVWGWRRVQLDRPERPAAAHEVFELAEDDEDDDESEDEGRGRHKGRA